VLFPIVLRVMHTWSTDGRQENDLKLTELLHMK